MDTLGEFVSFHFDYIALLSYARMQVVAET